ncbi:unnamed protein product [Arctogadus glacialis]
MHAEDEQAVGSGSGGREVWVHGSMVIVSFLTDLSVRGGFMWGDVLVLAAAASELPSAVGALFSVEVTGSHLPPEGPRPEVLLGRLRRQDLPLAEPGPTCSRMGVCLRTGCVPVNRIKVGLAWRDAGREIWSSLCPLCTAWGGFIHQRLMAPKLLQNASPSFGAQMSL